MYNNWDYGKEAFVFDMIDDHKLSYDETALRFEEKFKESITAVDIELKHRQLKGEKITMADIEKSLAKKVAQPKSVEEEDSASKSGRKKSLTELQRKRLIKDILKGMQQGFTATNMSKRLAKKYSKNWSTLYAEYKRYLAEQDEQNAEPLTPSSTQISLMDEETDIVEQEDSLEKTYEDTITEEDLSDNIPAQIPADRHVETELTTIDDNFDLLGQFKSDLEDSLSAIIQQTMTSMREEVLNKLNEMETRLEKIQTHTQDFNATAIFINNMAQLLNKFLS